MAWSSRRSLRLCGRLGNKASNSRGLKPKATRTAPPVQSRRGGRSCRCPECCPAMIRPAHFLAIVLPPALCAVGHDLVWRFHAGQRPTSTALAAVVSNGPACCSGFLWWLGGLGTSFLDHHGKRLGRIPAITLTMALGGLAYAVVALTSGNRLLIGLMLCYHSSLCQAVLSIVFLPMVAELGGNRPGRSAGGLPVGGSRSPPRWG